MSTYPLFRAQGAFLGLAIGDAYGRPLKFDSGLKVRNKPVSLDGNIFKGTDETCMALYVAEAVLSLNSPSFDTEAFGASIGKQLLLWSLDPMTPYTNPSSQTLTGLQNYQRSKDWRTSGITRMDTSDAILRVCPLAIAYQGEDLDQAATIVTMFTHSHPNSIGAAVATARLLRKALESGDFHESMVIAEVQKIRQTHPEASDVALAMEAAIIQARRRNLDWLDEKSIPPGDGGKQSPSVLGLAITAALHWQQNIETAIEKSARTNGESDTTAALTGMFLGATRGLDSLPFGWIQALPTGKDIATKSQHLWQKSDQPAAEPPNHIANQLYQLHKVGAIFAPDTDPRLERVIVKVPKSKSSLLIALRSLSNTLGEPLTESGPHMTVAVDPSLVPASLRRIAYQKEEAAENWEAEVDETGPQEDILEAEIITEDDSTFSPNPSKSGKSNIETPEQLPIKVTWLTEYLPPGHGRLGLTFAPGKKQTQNNQIIHDRTLDNDLNHLKAVHQVDVLISLVEDQELTDLHITELAEEASRRRIAVIRFPIADRSIPSQRQALQIIQTSVALAKAGQHVVFHCRGGLGRAGTMAACSLIALGANANDAIQYTRQRRPGAIETTSQEDFIREFAINWNRP